MKQYRNRSGNSGVEAYESGPGYILVKFSESSRAYRYSYAKAGKYHVENMKRLAEAGRGLSSYISRYAKNLFDRN